MRERFPRLNGGSRNGRDAMIQKKCDLCGVACHEQYYDARLPKQGSWANLCRHCFEDNGCSVGLGRGQNYVSVGEKWVKVAE
jgi:hypothetical protein